MQTLNISRPNAIQQRGISLIEALISLLIVSITVAGSIYVVSRANATKAESSLQEIAIHTLRQKLMNNDGINLTACTATDISIPNGAGGTQALAVTVESGCDGANVATITVAGAETTIDGMHGRIALSVNDALVGGKVQVGGS